MVLIFYNCKFGVGFVYLIGRGNRGVFLGFGNTDVTASR